MGSWCWKEANKETNVFKYTCKSSAESRGELIQNIITVIIKITVEHNKELLNQVFDHLLSDFNLCRKRSQR